ncbi:phytoene desaturase family protein [Metabacillus idriensis]|uniref:phytoene desaturase family protein n=1 Tax=Metabacillus idriensis TaxID=324768 RepID=UPI002812B219|nr:phytoene desaturase family protein [Metabacillus idriensis]MDR0136394.1 phytoene desaturase family protein [Metabacillus idriensis]
MKKAVIIGAGLGGLSAAITLASRGFKVDVFEKNSHAGGKLMPVDLGDYHFDFGPNTITMPQVFERVFSIAGEKMQDYIEMIKLDVHTRNVFENGAVFDFTSRAAAMKKQLETADPFAAEHYDSFLEEITRLYKLSETHFFPKMFESFTDYLSPSLGTALLKVRPLESMHHFFSRYFKNPDMIKAFDRYATYIGSSPYISPATFAMIAYLELLQGVFYVKGGNVKIAEAYLTLAEKLGVQFHFNSEVMKIDVENKRASCAMLSDGQRIAADEFVMNADLLEAFPNLVREQDRPNFTTAKRDRYQPSISAFVILAGLTIRNPQLLHHNVFFSEDYETEFRELFSDHQYSETPTIYISNSSYSDRTVSPHGDNLFILVNAPALTKEGTLVIHEEEYKERIYDLLEKKGVQIRGHLACERIITPLEISKTFGAYRGALYGISANRKIDAFLRPSNFAKDIKNLSFVGGSTHPGGGSPMVTLSGINVGEALAKRY